MPVDTVDITSTLFQLPEDLTDGLYEKLTPANITDFTTGAITGTGVFDKMMASLGAQLESQEAKGLITGAEYSKAYIALVQIAMQTALQFALQADTSYWQNQQAQIAAITGRIAMEKARYEYLAAQYQVETILPLQSAGLTLDNAGKTTANSIAAYQLSTVLPAQVALTNAQKSHEDAETAVANYQVSTLLPGQVLLTASQKIGQDDQNAILAYNLATVLPGQVALTLAQKNHEDAETSISAYQLSTVLPGQVAFTSSQKTLVDTQNSSANYTLTNILPEQKTLTHEQAEVQHAQTLDVRLDGTTSVTGLVGKQKALYSQQITSYQRDAEVKAAKLFSDAWITQKTMDEGLLPPLGFTNTSVNEVLTVIMANNSFGTPAA